MDVLNLLNCNYNGSLLTCIHWYRIFNFWYPTSVGPIQTSLVLSYIRPISKLFLSPNLFYWPRLVNFLFSYFPLLLHNILPVIHYLASHTSRLLVLLKIFWPVAPRGRLENSIFSHFWRFREAQPISWCFSSQKLMNIFLPLLSLSSSRQETPETTVWTTNCFCWCWFRSNV